MNLLFAAGLGLTLLTGCLAEAPLSDRGSTEAPPRLPTEREEHICHENTYRGDGPANNDCSILPDGPIYEDDPWGRWDCATMGNKICGNGPDEANMSADEISEHESFNALRSQLKERGQWGMTADEENLYRAEFVSNSLNDPNRGRPGYLQAEDGSWVHDRYWERSRP